MSHQNRHRGPHPKDEKLFAQSQLPNLRHAIQDYCWLLTKGYTAKAGMKLVGDRFKLTDRQRLLITRCACSQQQKETRLSSEVPPENMSQHELWIDGFNVLITIESALSNGFLFRGTDGCVRDMASIHGTYRRVNETSEAILLIGNYLNSIAVKKTTWLLDQPVSNSGRLMCLIDELAAKNDWPWQSRLCKSPDYELKQFNGIAATADGVILDAVSSADSSDATGWFNLARHAIESQLSERGLTVLDGIPPTPY